MYTVRDARPDDGPALQALDRLFAGPRHSDQLFLDAIADGRMAVAEVEGGGVVGYVRWEYFWDTIPLCLAVCVQPQHQRRGIGRRLYEHIEDGFRRAGHTFWLSSTEETNDISKRFHEALGFRRIGALKELGQDVPEVFYRKDLR
jgi:ribosomal protein S18 acetylase RimI-like enzyme